MVKSAYVDRNGKRKGEWNEEEDRKLSSYILRYGTWNWRLLPKYAGLDRCGKSCRLRWVNYLQPGIKRGNYTPEEDNLIIQLHHQLGNKWSAIAKHFPARTDNDIKNWWHAHLSAAGCKRRKNSGKQKPKPKNKSWCRKQTMKGNEASMVSTNNEEAISYVVSKRQQHEPKDVSCNDDILVVDKICSTELLDFGSSDFWTEAAAEGLDHQPLYAFPEFGYDFWTDPFSGG